MIAQLKTTKYFRTWNFQREKRLLSESLGPWTPQLYVHYISDTV